MPRRAAFCKSSILVVTPSSCLERLVVTAPSTPTTIGTTFALTFQSRATSLRRSWYFSTFSLSFSTIPSSPGTAISIILQAWPVLLLVKLELKGSVQLI